jgi:hypothetical protein
LRSELKTAEMFTRHANLRAVEDAPRKMARVRGAG